MKQKFTKLLMHYLASNMSNRLLINITNAIEWLKTSEDTKEFYKDVINFLEKAAKLLQPAVEGLRGKDIHHTEKIKDEDSLLMTLNDLIDHFDYIKHKDGLQVTQVVEKTCLQLDFARQTIRLGSAKIPEIRDDLEKLINKVTNALAEETDNINLKTALVRMNGTRHDLANV